MEKVAIGAAALTLSVTLHAQQLSVNIPAGDLKAAIDAYSSTTGVEVVYRGADLKGLSTKGAQGSMTAVQALEKLLEGTALKVRRDSSGAVVIFEGEARSDGVSGTGPNASPAITQTLEPVVIYGSASHLASENRTGTRLEADPMTVPLSVTTVEKGLLDQQQALTLRDAVSNVAGVNDIDGNGSFTMRGFSAGLMRNGNLVTSPSGIDVPLIALSRLEVVKGPEAIIAGVSAGYGGVINIISKTPQVAPVSEVSGIVGSHRYWEIGADLGRPLDADKQFLGRLVLDKQGSGVNAYGYDGQRSEYVAPSLTWRNKPTRTEVTVQYEYQKKRTPTPGEVFTSQNSLSGDLQPFRAGTDADGIETKNSVATLSANQFIAEGWSVGLNYVDESRKNNGQQSAAFPGSLIGLDPTSVVALGQNTVSTYKSRSLKLELKGNVETGPLEHQLLLAYDRAHRHAEAGLAASTLVSIDPATGAVTDLVPTLGTAFGVPSPLQIGGTDPLETGVLLLDQMQWGDWVALGGVRYIDFKPNSRQTQLPTFNRTLPSLGILYRFTPSLSLFANASKGFTPNSGNVAFGGNSIPPEDAQQAELGVKWLIPGRKAAVTASVFDIKQKNVAIGDQAHQGQVCGGQVCYISVPGITSKGAELEVSGQIVKGFEVRANYNFLQLASDTPNLPVPSWTKHQANIWGTYHFSGDTALGWWAGGGLQVRGSRNVASGYANNPGQGRIDVSTGYDTKGWSVVAGVKNAADKRLYTLQSGLFDLGVPYQPREFFVTARYHFD